MGFVEARYGIKDGVAKVGDAQAGRNRKVPSPKGKKRLRHNNSMITSNVFDDDTRGWVSPLILTGNSEITSTHLGHFLGRKMIIRAHLTTAAATEVWTET